MCDQKKREGVDLMLSKFSINFHKNIVESGLNRLGLFFSDWISLGLLFSDWIRWARFDPESKS